MSARPFLAAFAEALSADDVLTDPVEMVPHLVDWRGQKQGRADVLLRPRDLSQVAAIVRVAAQYDVALVPQGGNTGLVGGSVPEPDGVRPTAIVSMRSMARIRAVDGDGLSLIAEAGAILANVESAAEAAGARFPLSLGAKGSATIGGLVSTNAGGVQVLRHGTMRQLVLGIEAVLADGTVLDQLKPLRKDNSGYDIKQLLIGAEGTLGIVTAVALKLAPRLEVESVGWAGVPDAGAALALLRRLRQGLGDVVESFELIGAEALDLVVALLPGMRSPLAGRHAFHVLIDVAAPLPKLEEVLAAALAAGEVEDATVATSLAQGQAMWKLRESVPEAERIEGPAVKNDISVAVADLPHFLAEALAMFETRFPHSRPIAFGHLGDGNLHFNLRPPHGHDPKAWLAEHQPPVRAALHDLVVQHGGSISAEHGIGTLKAGELQRLGNPAKLAAMRAIKQALDPQNIFNPGKIFA